LSAVGTASWLDEAFDGAGGRYRWRKSPDGSTGNDVGDDTREASSVLRLFLPVKLLALVLVPEDSRSDRMSSLKMKEELTQNSGTLKDGPRPLDLGYK
jgi:hypothetical protein